MIIEIGTRDCDNKISSDDDDDSNNNDNITGKISRDERDAGVLIIGRTALWQYPNRLGRDRCDFLALLLIIIILEWGGKKKTEKYYSFFFL